MNVLWNHGAEQIYKALDGQVRLVGGCVRDYLLRRPIHDRDLATPLEPDVVEEKLRQAKIDYVSIGKAHGTITAKINKVPYEITTLRKDDKTDGRHAVVAWTTSYKADAARRDFTVNALYVDIKNRISDFATGRSDLAQGLIRFIGDPEKRIQEDYLRILRYFRFWSAISSLPLDKKVVQLCAHYVSGLEVLSEDRLRDEVYRLIQTPRAKEALTEMKKAGILTERILKISFSKKQMAELLKSELCPFLKKLGFHIKGESNDKTK